MTEPNLDDWKPIFVNGVIPKEFKDYIANQVREARINELEWVKSRSAKHAGIWVDSSANEIDDRIKELGE